MASIRRTLSPVPRPGTLPSGENCSVSSSPLSKSSSYNQNHQPSGPFSSSSLFSLLDDALYRIQAFMPALFSQRSSRPVERPKLKVQFWRRALFHFSICFVVGIFVGFTPLVSMNWSVSLMSKHQPFSSFEMLSPIKKFYHVAPRNKTQIEEKLAVYGNSTLERSVTEEKLAGYDNSTLEGSVVKEELGNETRSRPLDQYLNVRFHKLLIIVTPTYARPFQAYYLHRLAQTLKRVPPPLLWIVVEMTSQSVETADILRTAGVMYRHLVCSQNSTEVKDRRVHQRNVALSHIEIHRLDGIVYFADDANIYSDELFEQMRQISRFGTWTVAKLMQRESRTMLEGPICNGTRVIGWHTDDMARRFRRFHAEMSGFAFNSTILWDPKRWHRPTLEPIRQIDTIKEGFQMSTFIEQIVEDEGQMEGLPVDCSKVMVWQLHVESSCTYPQGWYMKNNLDVIAPLALKF